MGLIRQQSSCTSLSCPLLPGSYLGEDKDTVPTLLEVLEHLLKQQQFPGCSDEGTAVIHAVRHLRGFLERSKKEKIRKATPHRAVSSQGLTRGGTAYHGGHGEEIWVVAALLKIHHHV